MRAVPRMIMCQAASESVAKTGSWTCPLFANFAAAAICASSAAITGILLGTRIQCTNSLFSPSRHRTTAPAPGTAASLTNHVLPPAMLPTVVGKHVLSLGADMATSRSAASPSRRASSRARHPGVTPWSECCAIRVPQVMASRRVGSTPHTEHIHPAIPATRIHTSFVCRPLLWENVLSVFRMRSAESSGSLLRCSCKFHWIP